VLDAPVEAGQERIGMAEWIETYRGIVSPWECDLTEHFTIAYYFDRLADAQASVAETLGLTDLMPGGVCPGRLDLRFVRELRAGASFHILSGPLAVDESGVRLGHRIIDSANDETVTWVVRSIDLPPAPPALREAIAGRVLPWEGPAIEPRPEPTTTKGFIPTARGRVKPGDLDASGHLSLAGFVHRFTDACIQALAAIGVSAEYMRAERRGYSTFELALHIAKPPRLGAAFLVETGIVHLGNSSVRFLHRMSDPRSGEEFARLGQFGVQLDLDARRPAALPEELRARAARILVPVA
jgi:acyl-CoA thioesterase FadM